jgi:hypothetical protein
MLRRKWTFRAHGKQVVFIKRSNERAAHVYMKAFLWALYLPDYPDLGVEIRIGDRYKPDVVEMGAWGEPHFWGEAGQVGTAKIRSLLKRYPSTHFAIAKWARNLEPLITLVTKALDGLDRKAPFDLISFSADSAERFIDERGHIQLTHEDVKWVRLQ